jgi:uncharacterized protein
MLHVATDWPGHFRNVAVSIKILIDAGADVHARFSGSHVETPLHWAASSDDLEALDALLDAGADIEATGAVLGGGPPLADAVGFQQWNVARRLVERGARVTLPQAAALGMMDRVGQFFTGNTRPEPNEINRAFWNACHGGQLPAAGFLFEQGADIKGSVLHSATLLLVSSLFTSPIPARSRSGTPCSADWTDTSNCLRPDSPRSISDP